MSDQLSDAALQRLFDSDEDLTFLTGDERRRLLSLAQPKAPPTTETPKADTPSSWSDLAPMAGGMIGSVAGGSKASPIGMAAAATGGAAGEGYKQLLQHGAEIPGALADVARNLFSQPMATLRGAEAGMREGAVNAAKAGGEQALYEGGGRAIGAAVKPLAKTIYGLALRPSQAIRRNVGGGNMLEGTRRVIGQGFDDAVFPSGVGAGRAGRKVAESRAEATAMAAASPKTVKTGSVLGRAESDQLTRMADELAAAGIRPRPRAVQEQLGRLTGAQGPDLTMAQLLKMRRSAGGIADPAFAAARQPGGAGRIAPGSEVSVAKSVADVTKQALDDALGEPFKRINQRTMARRGVEQAAREAGARPQMLQNVVAGVAGGGGAVLSDDPAQALTNAMLLRALMSPTAWGAGALALGKLPYAQLLRLLQHGNQPQE